MSTHSQPSAVCAALRIVFPITLVAVASMHSAASAQSANDPQLPTVIVTASRLPQTLPDTTANTTLITRSDIDASVAQDLPSLLLQHAGVEFGRNGGVGQTANVFMRGTNAYHTLVLIDGVPANTQDSGGASARMELLPLDVIDRIEIVRGNVSAQYGSSAIGGVVQIFTRQGRSNRAGLGAQVSFELGSQGHRKAQASVSAGNADTQIRVSAARTTDRGISAELTSQAPGASPDLDGVKQSTGLMSLTHRASAALKLGVTALSTQQAGAYDDEYAALVTDDQRYRQRLTQVGAFADWQVNPMWGVQAKISQQTNAREDTVNSTRNSESRSQRQFVSLQNNLALGALGTGLLALEIDKQRYQGQSFGFFGSSTPSVERTNTALLAGLQGKSGAFAWNVNLRQDRFGAAFSPSAVNTHFLGASYDVTPNWSLRGSVSTAFNLPSLGQLYDPLYGNTALAPERAKNQEIGLQWAQGAYLVRASAFKARLNNMFGFNPITYQPININRVKNDGFELIAEAPMPWAGGRLRANLNTQEPVNELSGLLLARRAKLQSNVSLAGQFGAYGWDVQLGYKGNRNDTDYSTFTPVVLKSYVKIDAKLRYAFSSKTTVSLALTNVSNVNDQSAYGYSGTPRGVVLGLNHTF